MNIKTLFKGALIASAFVSVAAQAATIPLPAGTAILEDDNVEFVLDAQGNLKTSGALVVGDRLRAFIAFENVLNGQNTVFTDLGGSRELTGVSEIEIAAINGSTIVFKPSAAFEAVYGAGATAALFVDTTADFTTGCNVTSIAECETTAGNGDHFLTAGFADADDFWIASSSFPFDLSVASVEAVAATSAVTKLGVAQYALSILENNTGYGFNEQVSALSPFIAAGGGDDGLTDIIGSGDILGGAGLSNGFFARSDFDFQLDRIPEPGSVALFGLGLIAAGALGRRRKAK